IPDGVTSIGGSAFSGCTGLTSIEIPDGVTSIGGSAFSGCTGLTSIEIPDGVTSIGGSAFSGCTGLTYIEIPNSVTSIGQSAFYDCKGLISITIPNGVTTIEQSVFGGCTGLTSVVWNMENYTSSMRDMFKDCPIEKFTFGESVEIVPENCCYGMKKLTSIEIPSNITTIGGSAFGNCTNLQSIKILNGNATIGKNNLTNCKGLTYIEAPASLIDVAEADMGNVTNSVETLIVNGGEVNENGYKFIDNQRKTIKCLDLSGASNNEIADEAFLDFYKPKFIFLPEGTTSIGYKSFSGCVSLRFARIPSSVTDIEYNAFNDCVGLEYIYCSAETPPTVVSAFTNVDKEIPVYVPCGKVDLYKKAKGWKEFENILCIDEAKQSEEVVAEPTAEPEETSVQLTWAVEHTAGKYVVTVMQDDEVVSILTFDPKGALIDYSTGSSRSASGLRSADANANSFVYTVKGLSKDTEYTYSVEVFDYDGAETEKYVGQFKTLGEVAVDENKFGENVSIKDAVSVFNKTVSVNGYEPSDIRVYNTVGQPVSNPVPASGVYVVKIGGEAVKVMVK
ncbi:MAG: leucine-rich repeat domain-containing protein, partial [Bacteroidales bacterium]|nr:leucine-rich repeat domain-containing protein [Bacteroidales bacterium]